MLKPDTVQRALIGRIIDRLEKKGFKLVAIKFMWVNNFVCFFLNENNFSDVKISDKKILIKSFLGNNGSYSKTL